MEIRLLVIRTPDMQRLVDFYTLLGFRFDYHRHAPSPWHYSTIMGKTVLEIYPLARDQEHADKHLRLGFGLKNFDETIAALKERSVIFLSELAGTEFGDMAVIEDPDGRKIELYQS
ncbi:VOC family protein [Chitinophagaceae bacterium MMS25-I14]